MRVNNPERTVLRCLLALAICVWPGLSWAQGAERAPKKVIIDTDIGDDVDDAFALALAVRSPALRILGVTTTFGDTETRAKLVDRFLAEVGHAEIPVAAGAPTVSKGTFTQRRYAEGGPDLKPSHPDAVSFV